MPQGSLIDKLLSEKANRAGGDVYPGVRDWFKQTFGADLPVKNIGESAFERSAGHEHSRAFDVGLNPNSAQGQALTKYLDAQGIPYLAFSGPVYRGGRIISTGQHIHVGIPSPNIGSSTPVQPGASGSLVDNLLQQKEKSLVDQLLEEKASQPVLSKADQRAAYYDQASKLRNANPYEKLARDIEWHFGYSILAEMPNLPPDKQRQIAELATQFAAADEEKKKRGIAIMRSPAWQLANQTKVGVNVGVDIPAHQPPDVQAQMARDFSAGANPLLKIPKSIRPVVEALGLGGADIGDFIAGMEEYALKGNRLLEKAKMGFPVSAAMEKDINFLRKRGREMREMSEEARATQPPGKWTQRATDVGAGFVGMTPLMIAPEAGIESIMGRIGLEALKFGAFTGTQEVGRGGTSKDIAVGTGSGLATGVLMGVPLPGKTVLKRQLANLAITTTGGTIINLATGQPLEKSVEAGVTLTLMRAFPELIGDLKVIAKNGRITQAKPADIQRIAERYQLPAARFEMQTGIPEPTRPLTVRPGKQTGTAERVTPGTQGELFTAVRPGAEAGRQDLPGFQPSAMSPEQHAQSLGLDVESPQAKARYEEYLKKVQSTAGQPAPRPPRYASWEKEANDAENAWKERNKGKRVKKDVDSAVKAAIAYARENGPTPEFRAFFAGIEPRLAGTTIAKVKAFADSLGIQWTPQKGWGKAEREAAKAAPAEPAPTTTTTAEPVQRGLRLGAAPEGAPETPPPPSGEEAGAATARKQRPTGQVAPMQQMFTLPGMGGERVPIFDSRLETTQDALVRLTRMRTDPEVWSNLSPADRASIGRSIAELKSGKTPEQIMNEAALSQQGPGVIRMSEETARKSLADLKEALKTARGSDKAAIQAQIDVLEKQQVGELPKVPRVTSPEEVADRQRVRWTTREQLNATPEQLNLMRREAAARVAENSPNVTTEDAVQAGAFEGQAGAVNPSALPGVSTAVKALRTARSVFTKRGMRAFMTWSRDAGDNQARISAQQDANKVSHMLSRALNLPQDIWSSLAPDAIKARRQAKDALSFVIESEGDPHQLSVMRSKIAASPDVPVLWRKRVNQALDYAQQHYAELQPVAEEYNRVTDAQRQAEVAVGIESAYRKGYVMHAQDLVDEELGWLASTGSGGGLPFREARVHDTFADSLAAGINPKSLDAVDLLNSRLARGRGAINRRAWIDGLQNVTDPKSGQPLLVHAQTVNGKPKVPLGYTAEDVGFQKVGIHRGYEGIFKAMTEPSAWQASGAGRFLTRANAQGKMISLALDTFHLGRMAFWESVIKGAGLGSGPASQGFGAGTIKLPRPSYRKGITLLDNTVPEIQDMISRGEVPAQYGKDLLENKRRIDLMVQHGYNVGQISDALYQDAMHHLPGIAGFNKWLFGQFQRGAMVEAGLLEFERLKRARGGTVSDEEIARSVAHDLNVRFGNLGRQGLFKSKFAQDTMRMLALAPQWNEGLIHSEVATPYQIGKAAVDVVRGKPFYTGILARSVGTLMVSQFVANQMINMVTRGHPTWENKEEGFGAKISAWIPDLMGKSDGFFLHPASLAAEISHLIIKGYERTDSLWQSFADYFRSRASILTRPAITFMSRRDFLGRPIRPEDLGGTTLRSAVPLPIPAPVVWHAVFGKQQYPGEFQSRAMQSFGVKVERVPSGEQRVRKLAQEWLKTKGVKESGEFYEGPYQQFTDFMTPQGLQDLLKVKDRQAISDYYRERINRPVTGSAEREREFKKTLNAEQMQQYEAAKEHRRQQFQEVRKLLANAR